MKSRVPHSESQPRFAGVELNLRGTVYTVPPLGMRAVRTLLPKIDAIDAALSELSSQELFNRPRAR